MSALDEVLRVWVISHRSHLLNPVMLGLTAIGAGGLVWPIIAVVLVIFRRGTWHAVLRVVVTMLVTTVVADVVIKPIVHRPRPFLVHLDTPVLGHRPHDWSFPSGHAADAAAGALVLSRTSSAGSVVWWLLAAGIAYSRVYLGVHYPSDIAGSVLVGVVCAALVMIAMQWSRKRTS